MIKTGQKNIFHVCGKKLHSMEIVGFFEAIIRSDLKQPLLEKHDQTSQRSHAQKNVNCLIYHTLRFIKLELQFPD